jgi:hypothetical protein
MSEERMKGKHALATVFSEFIENKERILIQMRRMFVDAL